MHFEVLEKKSARDNGFLKIEAITVAKKLFNGEMSKPFTYEVCNRGHVVTVLPYDPILDAVLITREMRPGAVLSYLNDDPSLTNHTLQSPEDCWVWAAPAGMVDKDFTSLADEAIREVMEETGKQLSPESVIGPLPTMPSAGGCSEFTHMFLAVTDLSGVGGNFGLESESEDINAVVLPYNTVKAMVSDQHRVVATTLSAMVFQLGELRRELRYNATSAPTSDEVNYENLKRYFDVKYGESEDNAKLAEILSDHIILPNLTPQIIDRIADFKLNKGVSYGR